ncbi:MAG: sulfotransferase [Actinomycetota bacterium]|nr:sulfotransferase [Actinomycetota bacterium]
MIDKPNAEPVFIGGVGRSGTHPMGRTVAADPHYHWIRTEVRFHAAAAGLPGVCSGAVGMQAFLERMRGSWYRRGARQKQGLQRIVERGEYEAALAEFENSFEADRIAAARRLVRRLLDPVAAADGKPAWCEITGEVIEQAPFLLKLFPDARFINMVRDGRAVVAGTLRKVDLTDDPRKALAKWERMVKGADKAIRSVGADRVLTVQLDDFTARDRDGTFARLIDFLQLEDPVEMRAYFEEEISGERAHVGKWRERIAPADAKMIDRRYRRMVKRMHRAGIDWAPAPED